MSNVRDFGAAGDGVHDDTQAIRHAVENGDGYLFFDRGLYKISQTIDIVLDGRGPFAIDGAGGTARILMTGPGPALRFVGTHGRPAHPEGIEDRIWRSERMPTVTSVSIEGEHAESIGIELIKTFQATLRGVHIRQCRHGIHVREHNRNLVISDCHIFHNRGNGIFIDQCNLHQVIVSGNHISYNRTGGIRLEGSQVYNLQITGNDIEYNNHRSHATVEEPTAEIYIDSTGPDAIVNEVTIASNTIQATESKGGANIRILDDQQDANRRLPGLFAISGNVIGNQETNVHLTGCHGIAISGNTIYSCGQHNVLVEDSDQISFTANVMRRHTEEMQAGVKLVDSANCLISGCIVEDESPTGQEATYSTLELENCHRISVSGSQFLSGVPYCLHVRDSSYVNVNGCTMADVRDDRVSKAAIRWSGSGRGNLIASCILGPVAGSSNPLEIDDESGVNVAENNLTESLGR